MHIQPRNRPARMAPSGARQHLPALSWIAALTCFVALAASPSTRAADQQAAQQASPPSTPQTTQQPTQVRVSTSMGDFVIELMPDRAPLTVANFLRYVREGYYTNTLFHRVIANFVIQGGGHDATDYKLKPVHEPVVNESGNGLQNKRGTVGLARGDVPHSGNAQFYVNLVDNPDLDPLPTRWGYAVFGKVVQGMDVVDRIGVTPTGAMGPFKGDAPLKPVVIQKVEIVDSSAASMNPPPPVATPVAPPSQDTILSPK